MSLRKHFPKKPVKSTSKPVSQASLSDSIIDGFIYVDPSLSEETSSKTISLRNEFCLSLSAANLTNYKSTEVGENFVREFVKNGVSIQGLNAPTCHEKKLEDLKKLKNRGENYARLYLFDLSYGNIPLEEWLLKNAHKSGIAGWLDEQFLILLNSEGLVAINISKTETGLHLIRDSKGVIHLTSDTTYGLTRMENNDSDKLPEITFSYHITARLDEQNNITVHLEFAQVKSNDPIAIQYLKNIQKRLEQQIVIENCFFTLGNSVNATNFDLSYPDEEIVLSNIQSRIQVIVDSLSPENSKKLNPELALEDELDLILQFQEQEQQQKQEQQKAINELIALAILDKNYIAEVAELGFNSEDISAASLKFSNQSNTNSANNNQPEFSTASDERDTHSIDTQKSDIALAQTTGANNNHSEQSDLTIKPGLSDFSAPNSSAHSGSRLGSATTRNLYGYESSSDESNDQTSTPFFANKTFFTPPPQLSEFPKPEVDNYSAGTTPIKGSTEDYLLQRDQVRHANGSSQQNSGESVQTLQEEAKDPDIGEIQNLFTAIKKEYAASKKESEASFSQTNNSNQHNSEPESPLPEEVSRPAPPFSIEELNAFLNIRQASTGAISDSNNDSKQLTPEKVTASIKTLLINCTEHLKVYKGAYEQQIADSKKEAKKRSCFYLFNSLLHGDSGIKRANEHYTDFTTHFKEVIPARIQIDFTQDGLAGRIKNCIANLLSQLILTAKNNLVEVHEQGSALRNHSYTVYLMAYIEELITIKDRINGLDESQLAQLLQNPDKIEFTADIKNQISRLNTARRKTFGAIEDEVLAKREEPNSTQTLMNPPKVVLHS